MRKVSQYVERATAALAGVAMLGTLGMAVVPTASAAETSEVNCQAIDWNSFSSCLSKNYYYKTININAMANIGNSEYQTLSIGSNQHVIVTGYSTWIQNVEFNVGSNARLTLKNFGTDNHTGDTALYAHDGGLIELSGYSGSSRTAKMLVIGKNSSVIDEASAVFVG